MACNILSIDGGGTRGIVPATIINCIEKETGNSILNYFDVIAGTSTGGIIATALAAGVTSEELVHLYQKKAKDIFRQSFFDKISGVDEYLEADYNNKGLKKELDRLLGKLTMKHLQDSAAFGKKGKHLMVCSFHLNPEPLSDGNRNYRPDVFYSGYIRDANLALAEICLMTSAAPTYFPIYANHIDGGVAMNNPAMAAVSFALNDHVSAKPVYRYPDGSKKGLNESYRNIKVVSLGTGTSNKTFIPEAQVKKGNWGKLKWINYLPDLMTEGNVQSTHYYVGQVLVDKNYIRWNPNFDSPDAPVILQTEPVNLDETDRQRLAAMHEYAVTYYKVNKQALLKLIGA